MARAGFCLVDFCYRTAYPTTPLPIHHDGDELSGWGPDDHIGRQGGHDEMQGNGMDLLVSLSLCCVYDEEEGRERISCVRHQCASKDARDILLLAYSFY